MDIEMDRLASMQLGVSKGPRKPIGTAATEMRVWEDEEQHAYNKGIWWKTRAWMWTRNPWNQYRPFTEEERRRHLNDAYWAGIDVGYELADQSAKEVLLRAREEVERQTDEYE